jgi:hypothetical protein
MPTEQVKSPTHRLEQKALQTKPIAEDVQGAFGKVIRKRKWLKKP